MNSSWKSTAEPVEKWYQAVGADSVIDAKGVLSVSDLAIMTAECEKVYLTQSTAPSGKKSSEGWLQTASTSGTSADRIAASTLLIQQSPVENLPLLTSLIKMINKKARRETSLVVDALKELFIDTLLPDRKLISLNRRPYGTLENISGINTSKRNKMLMLWRFEHSLKQAYMDFIKCLEELSFDTVIAVKQKGISTLFDLLMKKPEQEKHLLSVLVNKIGDTSNEAATKVVHFLQKLLHIHSKMKSIVIAEVERLLYRINVTERAKHFGISFLTQIRIGPTETAMAAKLLDIYFNLFKLSLKDETINNRILSVLLVGINRAFPHCKENSENLMDERNTLFKIAAVSSFHASIQALMLLFQVLEASEGTSDRFYAAIYRKMLDPFLPQSSHVGMFFHLVFKAMKADPVAARTRAFVKRLLQLAAETENCAFSCSILLLINAILEEKRQSVGLSLAMPCESGYTATNETSEDFKPERPSALTMSDDEDEKYSDILDSDEEDVKPDVGGNKVKGTSWVHRSNLDKKAVKSSKKRYDPFQRNPLFADADWTCEYELLLMRSHFHPSVAVFAQKVLDRVAIAYPGDPITDFTLMRFLDRFVYRNPKAKDPNEKQTQFAQDLRRSRNGGEMEATWKVKKLSVLADEYALKSEVDIPPDELYLHRFISAVAKPVKQEDESDIESVRSDEFDELIEKFEPDGKDDDFHFDEETRKTRAKKGKIEESQVDLDELDVEFGDDPDYKRAFADFDTELDDLDFAQLTDDSNKKMRKKLSKKKGTAAKRKANSDEESGTEDADKDEFDEILESAAKGTKSNDWEKRQGRLMAKDKRSKKSRPKRSKR